MNKKKHHYIPRFYLKGFSESEDSPIIHIYQKGQGFLFSTTEERIAYENHFYTVTSPDGSKDSNTMEDYLHDEIEKPANIVISKIRDRQAISRDEKSTLSKYIVYLMKRVPRARQRIRESAPEIKQSVIADINEEFAILIELDPDNRKKYEDRRDLEILTTERLASEIPDGITMGVLRYPSPMAVSALSSMSWMFLCANKSTIKFITNDNPVFYDESIGISHQHSEVSVPLSKDVALWATWQADSGDMFSEAHNQFIKEINRRTASNATRYIFSSQKVDWVEKLVVKSIHRLHRLQ